jgi:hypothetical protein
MRNKEEGGRRRAEGGIVCLEHERRSSLRTTCSRHIEQLATIAFVCTQIIAATASAEPFSFDDIQFWVGEGANRSALAIDWVEDSSQPPALVWGYRWDGTATGRDMLLAIVEADDRLFAKLGNSPANPVRLYGLGYDTDNDGEFGACNEYECTEFDEFGLAYSGEIYVAATATDAGDYYREGWATGTGFWHYGISTPPGSNPYDGGQWSDTQSGMATRALVDGSWDSWAFQYSTIPPFTSYAENPQAAVPPWGLAGDYDGSGVVDDGDYVLWKSTFGLTGDQAADGNGDGIVDAADYTVWRDHLGAATGGLTIAAERAVSSSTTAVPEPATAVLAIVGLLAFAVIRPKKGFVGNQTVDGCSQCSRLSP